MGTAAARTKFEVGQVFPEWRTSVSAERQARYHAGAEVDGGVFGGAVDPSVLANDCIHGRGQSGETVTNSLHYGIRIRQSEPVRLGEELIVRGRVARSEAVPRGTVLTMAFDFVRPDGSVPIAAENYGLFVDTSRPAPGGHKPTAPSVDGFRTVARKQVTPEKVADYSFEFTNFRVHFDPEVAARLGLRAPLAQGLQAVTYMVEQIWRRRPPQRLDIGARFLRPLFWDEAVEIQAREEGGRISALRCVTPEGKVTSEALVHDLAFRSPIS